jgi:uncharacterized protein
MEPLNYHAGQRAIQAEAKTTHVADKLAHWVGPVAEFARGADLFVLATANGDRTLSFSALSGTPPLADVIAPSDVRLRDEPEGVRIRFRPDLAPPVSAPTACGGLVISLASARRARINGHLLPYGATSELVATESFTLCRKYVAPSLPLADEPHLGPLAREPLPLDDPWLNDLLARAETAFLASVSPNGMLDVAHRGGPPGFLVVDVAERRIRWEEYIGDGVFKSAGNIRETGMMALLVPDLASGDAIELVGRATYHNLRTSRYQRQAPLEQHRTEYPVQGVMTCTIDGALRLRDLMHPREPVVYRAKVTSCSTVDTQAPQ